MARNDFNCQVTYQGYDALACSVNRKPGVTSDHSWVDLATEDVKRIVVREDFRLWQSVGVKDAVGPIPLPVARRLLRPTITTPPLPGAEGFLRGGLLEMQTSVDERTEQDGSFKIFFMFLAPSGMEEIEEDLSDALLHNKGRLRVNLVDFRHFWRNHGSPMFGRYNIVNENGKFDFRTIQAGGEPWSAADVFDWIAISLPGSPAIHRASEINGSVPAPVNLDMKGELPVEWLSKLLDAYGMECHLTFDHQLFIARRGASHTVRRFRFRNGDQAQALPMSALPENPIAEKKTIFVNDRPEAVMVVGERRQRRWTARYEPAFIDEDQQVRRMADLDLLWGYSLDAALEQALQPPEKSYEDVPGDPAQRFARIRIAKKDFFKLYAPSFLFQGVQPTGGQAPPPGGPVGAPADYWPFETERHPLMPMKDPWFLPAEMTLLARDGSTGGAAPEERELLQTEIIVRANQIAQRYGSDISSILAAGSQQIANLEAQETRLNRLKREKDTRLQALKDLVKPDEFIRIGRGGPTIQSATLAKGVDQLLSNIAFGDIERVLRESANLRAYLDLDIQTIETEIQKIDEQLVRTREATAEQRGKLQGISGAISAYGFARLWMNIPWGTVDVGDYTIQKERGLILFNDVVGVMSSPATYDLENVKLIDDGQVELTWMTEVLLGTPEEFSTWTFIADRAGGPPKLCRVSELTFTKPFVVAVEGLTMYENEVGEVLNARAAAEKAARYAVPLLSAPRQQVGFTYRYPGLWGAVTDGAVNQVTWELQDGIGTTSIVANNPDQDVGWASVTRKRHEEALIYGQGG